MKKHTMMWRVLSLAVALFAALSLTFAPVLAPDFNLAPVFAEDDDDDDDDDEDKDEDKDKKKRGDRKPRKPFAQMSDEHTGLSGDHTGLSSGHTDLSGEHTNLTGDHTGLSNDHTGLSEKLDQVIEAINDLPAGGAPPCGAGTEGDRFVVSAAGTEVCDNTTGLVWEQMPDSILRSWQEALDHCPTLGNGSRLPEVKELMSLVDHSQFNPALPAGHPFSNVGLAANWSATTFADGPTNAWVVLFDDGLVVSFSKGFNFFVWCVRNGSAGPDQ